jgi:hypothetical protein
LSATASRIGTDGGRRSQSDDPTMHTEVTNSSLWEELRRLRRENRCLQHDNRRLQAETERLHEALRHEAFTAGPLRYWGGHELTAGTCEGPRPRA